MIPFARGPSLNGWGRALCVADFRSKAFAPQRGKIARKNLLGQPDTPVPWNLRKGRTRNYAGEIAREPMIQLGADILPSIDMITSPTFVFEGACLPSVLLATTLLTGCAEYRGGLLPQIERLRHHTYAPGENTTWLGSRS